MAKSKEAALLESKSASEEHRISSRSSEPNLKYKTKFQEYKELEFSTVVADRLQSHERSNPSFKRTRLRRSA